MIPSVVTRVTPCAFVEGDVLCACRRLAKQRLRHVLLHLRGWFVLELATLTHPSRDTLGDRCYEH